MCIRDRDKVKLQQEMMALYKREKVNPLSGCLPILIQIPFFFAIYKMLFISLEMRHQPFFGWIKDLSAQDPTSIFNFFGLIPWDPPSFLIIGAWPIMMGATMYLQQKLNPTPPDPIQAKIFMFFPLFSVPRFCEHFIDFVTTLDIHFRAFWDHFSVLFSDVDFPLILHRFLETCLRPFSLMFLS